MSRCGVLRGKRAPHAFGRRRREEGQSLVEMAIVLPVLLALIVGIFEFSRAWNVYQVITNAAREGARVGILPNKVESDVRNSIDTYLTQAALESSVASVSVTGADQGTGTPTTVQIQYPYEFAFLGPVVGMLGDGGGPAAPPGSITLSTTVIMRNE